MASAHQSVQIAGKLKEGMPFMFLRRGVSPCQVARIIDRKDGILIFRDPQGTLYHVLESRKVIIPPSKIVKGKSVDLNAWFWAEARVRIPDFDLYPSKAWDD